MNQNTKKLLEMAEKSLADKINGSIDAQKVVGDAVDEFRKSVFDNMTLPRNQDEVIDCYKQIAQMQSAIGELTEKK